MSTRILRTEAILMHLALLPDAERAEWLALLHRAAANLSNAEYAFAGNVPAAQPDPETWAAVMFSLGTSQLERALELLDLTAG